MLFQEFVGLTGVPSRLGAPKHMSYKNDCHSSSPSLPSGPTRTVQKWP